MDLSKYLWRLRIFLKVVLGNIGIPYAFWQKVGLFRHGRTDSPLKALNTYSNYYGYASKYQSLGKSIKVLELGPGDSVLTGFAAKAFGASDVYLVDAGNYTNRDVSGVLELKETVTSKYNYEYSDRIEVLNDKSLDELLKRNNINYLTEGTVSLKSIPSDSVDFWWSQVVLEHIYFEDFERFFTELRRIVKLDSIGIHSIDFRDHLGGGLNNLRFSNKTWEAPWFAKKGFYTNRIRPSDMLRKIEQSGFIVEVLQETRWDEFPLNRGCLDESYVNCSDDDLLICELEILIRPDNKFSN